MSEPTPIVELQACASTQDEARARARRAPGRVVAVATQSQQAGRGRGGRHWVDPPGAALLVSIARCGELPAAVLHELPRRVADAVRGGVAAQVPARREAVAWKAPNDLVDAASGAKLAGIVVDARTVGAHVVEVVVGIGVNLDADPFTTPDGRDAGSLRSATGTRVDRDRFARDVVAAVTQLLVAP